MPHKSQALCWVVTDGKLGMENQALGLADALAGHGVAVTTFVKRVRLRTPWRQLSPFFRFGLSGAYGSQGDEINPPWPDLMIVSGRASVPAALRARRESGGKTLTVYIQNPIIDPSRFDLVVVPRHDDLWGERVATTRGSLHRATPAFLAQEAARFKDRFKSLPRPWFCVAIGGSNSVYSLTPHRMREIVAQLSGLAERTGGSLLVTASRRTGDENRAILAEGLKGVSSYVWDGLGDNPYYGMLGAADVLMVTCDSVNMASEACSTGKPVYIIEMPGGSDKFRRFHQALRDDGMTRPFRGEVEDWTYAPLDDVNLVAARVARMLRERRGEEGP